MSIDALNRQIALATLDGIISGTEAAEILRQDRDVTTGSDASLGDHVDTYESAALEGLLSTRSVQLEPAARVMIGAFVRSNPGTTSMQRAVSTFASVLAVGAGAGAGIGAIIGASAGGVGALPGATAGSLMGGAVGTLVGLFSGIAAASD